MTQYRFTSAALFELKEGALYYEQKENGLSIMVSQWGIGKVDEEAG